MCTALRHADTDVSLSVDIYHVAPELARFAFVAYSDVVSGQSAVDALHERPIDLESAFARENAPDLLLWRGWPGQLKVVFAEPHRLVPSTIVTDFPNLPDWASESRATTAKSASPVKAERASSPTAGKRDHTGHRIVTLVEAHARAS